MSKTFFLLIWLALLTTSLQARKIYLIQRNWSVGYLISVALPAEPASKK